MSDDPTEGMPEPAARTPAGSDAPADGHADAAAPIRRMVSVPVWAILLGVILLLAGSAAAALALGGSSPGHTGPAAAPVTTTSTSLASDFPAGAAPDGTAVGSSGGGSTSGGSRSGGSGGTTTTTKPAPANTAPTLTNLSVNPNYVVCPQFGGDTGVTISFAAHNATSVQFAVLLPDGYQGIGAASPTSTAASVTIPCNGKQQHLIAYALSGTVSPNYSLYVNEGLEGH